MTRAIFTSTSVEQEHYVFHSGQEVEVVGPLPEKDYDREDVGLMLRVKFSDGSYGDVFEDELTPVSR